MIPLMTFVPVEGAASREYVAAFRQNALQRLHKGEPAELMFPAIPGTVFRGEVADVLPAIGESQFQGQGKLLTTDALNTHGRALVVLKVTDPRFAEYALPQGGYPRGGGLLGSSERAVADQEDPDPYEKLGKLYLSRSLSRRARGGRTAPRRGQASLSTRPSIITCCTPLRTGFNTPAHPIDGRQSLGVMTAAGVPSPSSWPAFEHQHVVGVTQGNIDVVHHHQGHDVAPPGLPAHQIHHVKLVVEVKGAERFVEQQQARLADQRLGETHQLLLPAGELIEVAHRQMGNPQLSQQRHHFLLALRTVASSGGALGNDNRLQHMQMHAGGQRLRKIDHLLCAT